MNWLIRQENVVAIPGVKKSQYVIDDVGAVDWRLNADEVEKLEKVAAIAKFDRLSGIPNIIRGLARH